MDNKNKISEPVVLMDNAFDTRKYWRDNTCQEPPDFDFDFEKYFKVKKDKNKSKKK